MKEKKRRTYFLPYGGDGGLAGLLLWYGLKKIVGVPITWWMGLVLMFICITVGVAFQAIDELKIKPDIVVRKNKNQSEDKILK